MEKQSKLLISALLVRPQGDQGGFADPGKNTEFDFLGFGCDHEALEPLETKNLSKPGILYEFWLFSRGFWLLVVLKQHGRICNLGSRILWFLPDL